MKVADMLNLKTNKAGKHFQVVTVSLVISVRKRHQWNTVLITSL